MTYNKNSLKRKVGSVILIVYSITLVLKGVLLMPKLTLVGELGVSFGVIVGVGFRIGIIMAYWYAVKTKYIKIEKRVSIKYLVLGVFLIMIAVPLPGINFIESFIIVSIGMIFRNDYKICLK